MRCTGRGQVFVEAGSAGRRWGYYGAARLPALMQWLEGGSDGEQELAERIYEAVLALLPAPEQARHFLRATTLCKALGRRTQL